MTLSARLIFVWSLLVFSGVSVLAAGPITPILSKDAYEILGVTREMSDLDIQKQYRRLTMKYHPDRFATASAEQQNIALSNFKIVKTCYEAIMAGDHRILINGIGFGPKGPHKRGSEGSDIGGSSHSYTSATDYMNAYTSGWTSYAASDRTEVSQPPRRMFRNGIEAVFENASGAIVMESSSKFYWLPAGETTLYPLYASNTGGFTSGRDGTIDVSGKILDVRVPTGRVGFTIKNSNFFIDDLVFYRSHLLDAEVFNQNLASRGFRILPRLNDTQLNLWTYYVYREGETFTIIAMNSYLAEYEGSTAVRVFVGNESEMVEIAVTYNRSHRTIDFASRGLTIDSPLFDRRVAVPIFDEATGLYLGEFNHTDQPLKIYAAGSGSRVDSERLMYEIPPLLIADRKAFSVPRLLGDLVELPVTVRTPLDDLVKKSPSQPRQASSAVGALFGPGIRTRGSSSHSASAPRTNAAPRTSAEPLVAVAPRSQSHQERSRERAVFVQSARIAFPTIATFLDYPEGDGLRLLVESYIRSSGERAAVEKVLSSTNPSHDRAMLLIELFLLAQSQDQMLDQLYLLESVVKDHIEEHSVMGTIAFTALSKMRDYLAHPRVTELVLKILATKNRMTNTMMVNHVFGSKLAMDQWVERARSYSRAGSACRSSHDGT